MAQNVAVYEIRTPVQLRREQRQQKALQLSLMGCTRAEVAQRLGMSARQVARDFERLRGEISKMIDKSRKSEIIAHALLSHEERKRILWREVYASKELPGLRLKALKELREEEDLYWSRLQDLGILPRAAAWPKQEHEEAPKEFKIIWGGLPDESCPEPPTHSLVDPEFPHDPPEED